MKGKLGFNRHVGLHSTTCPVSLTVTHIFYREKIRPTRSGSVSSVLSSERSERVVKLEKIITTEDTEPLRVSSALHSKSCG